MKYDDADDLQFNISKKQPSDNMLSVNQGRFLLKEIQADGHEKPITIFDFIKGTRIPQDTADES